MKYLKKQLINVILHLLNLGNQMLLDYETKFDLMAENESKRMIEFGEAVKLASIKAISNETGIQSIDIK